MTPLAAVALFLLSLAALLCVRLIVRGARSIWRRTWFGDDRPAIPAEIRRAVLDRDGRACRECGSAEELEIDHFDSWKNGGAHADPDNLQTLCRPCNRSKSYYHPGIWEAIRFRLYLWTK